MGNSPFSNDRVRDAEAAPRKSKAVLTHHGTWLYGSDLPLNISLHRFSSETLSEECPKKTMRLLMLRQFRWGDRTGSSWRGVLGLAILEKTSFIVRRTVCRLAVTNHRPFSSNVVSVTKNRTIEYNLFTMRMKGPMVIVLVIDLMVIGQMEGLSTHDAATVERFDDRCRSRKYSHSYTWDHGWTAMFYSP